MKRSRLLKTDKTDTNYVICIDFFQGTKTFSLTTFVKGTLSIMSLSIVIYLRYIEIYVKLEAILKYFLRSLKPTSLSRFLPYWKQTHIGINYKAQHKGANLI